MEPKQKTVFDNTTLAHLVFRIVDGSPHRTSQSKPFLGLVDVSVMRGALFAGSRLVFVVGMSRGMMGLLGATFERFGRTELKRGHPLDERGKCAGRARVEISGANLARARRGYAFDPSASSGAM